MLAVVLAAIPAARGAPTMPNVGYAASGYNIFYANPHSTQAGVDPGFVTHAGSPIFAEAYSGTRTTDDGRYNVPDGFTLRSETGCHLTFSSTSTAKTSEYKSSLETALSVSGSSILPVASFSASMDYKHFQSRTGSERKKSVSSVAECVAYSMIREKYAGPAYSDNFKRAVEAMPADYGDGSAYFDLLDEFGTHAIKEVTMGARFGISSYFTEQGWGSMVGNGIDVGLAAQYQAEVSAGVKLDVKSQQTAQEAFDANMTDYEMITLGSVPTAGDQVKWAQQAISEPMPIRYSLVSLCEFVTYVMDPEGLLTANCKKALDQGDYCKKRVLHRGDVTSCDAETDRACIWGSDCGPAEECVNNFCQQPSERGTVVPINRYWHGLGGGYNSFHPAPAWDEEHDEETDIFYAFTTPVAGAVPINRYCSRYDNTFHPSPPWDGEENCGDAIFYAHSERQPGTVQINRYSSSEWRTSTFHPAPEWPSEYSSGDGIFFAYAKPASCSAHPACSTNGGDCCPTAHGAWMRCCDGELSTLV